MQIDAVGPIDETCGKNEGRQAKEEQATSIDLNNRFDLHFIECDKLRMMGIINENIG
jgi:hypothetical protein